MRRPLPTIILLVLVGPAARAAEDRADVELSLAGDRGTKCATLAIRVADRPLAESWDRAVAALLRHFDRDGDGAIDRAEAGRLPSPPGLRQVAWGIFRFDGPAPPWGTLDTDADGRVAAAELSAFYRDRGAGPVLAAVGRAPFTERLDAALVARLDGDGDGVLVLAELRDAEGRLRALDRDGDGAIAAGELVPGLSYPGTRATHPLAGPGVPLVVRLAADPVESPIWPATIAAARSPWRTLDAGDVVLHLRADAGTAGADLLAHRRQLTTLFNASDDDGDRRIAGPELEDPARAILVLTRDWADRDGDGALAEAELDDWFGLLDALVRARVLLSVLDHGRGLFEAIDADHDGRIGPREARSAADRLAAAGAIAGGRLVPGKLPRILVACVGPGHPSRSPAPRPPSGLDWFDGMDRNRDGDLAADEWLGEPAAFRRLDADGDGLVSPAEAASSPRSTTP